MPQDLALYDELSARANLRFFGALYGLSRAPRSSTAIAVDASSWSASPIGSTTCVKTYSGGMKRRLNLAAGLLHDPDILLLDEPTVGVDPQSRNAIFDNLETLKSRGKALLYTTHYMEEVERLADRIVVIDHGKVIADDTLAGLQSRVAGRRRRQGDARIGVSHADRKEPARLMALIPLLAMVRKDLQLFFSDRRSVIVSFVVPIAIASFFGSIFSGGAGSNSEPARIAVAIVDQDGSAISKAIVAGAQADKNLKVTHAGGG